MDITQYGLVGLFFVSFLSSTLYPLGSEAFVVAFIAFGFSTISVLIVATLGNTLGAVNTYFLAYFGNELLVARFFPNASKKIEVIAPKLQKYGYIYAFFSFLPFFGDLFVLGLGIIKYPILQSIFFIALGKFLRYAFLAFGTSYFVG